MRTISLRLLLLSLGSGLLQALPFPLAGPVPLWRRLVCWFCLTPLLLALLRKQPGKSAPTPVGGFLLGYLCGFVWYLANCYWIYPTMHRYGGLPPVASAGILVLFSLYLGLYHALFGGVLVWLRTRRGASVALLASPFLWVAVELARARITGFPWDLLGYTQVDNLTLSRLAPVTGVLGLSLVIAGVNALWLARFVVKSRRTLVLSYAAASAGTIILSVLALFSLPTATEPAPAEATLVQTNLSVGAEGLGPTETRDAMLASFSALSLQPTYRGPLVRANGERPTDLLVWPEAPTSFTDADPVVRAAAESLARRAHAPLILDDVSLGSLGANGRYNLYNSASFYLANGAYAGRYDKMHLVPFGEYTPYKPLFFFAGHLLDDLPFVPGLQRRLFDTNTHRYGVFICYESIFGDEIRRFTKEGAQLLVNISDDGWYGDSSAPWEHLDMVRMRAIENHRWVLRSTNTGVTAAIDPYGRITATMPRHVRGALAVRFDYEHDLTFYTRFGDWLGWLCVLVVLGCLAVPRSRWAAPAAA